jgi:hypothetical protein
MPIGRRSASEEADAGGGDAATNEVGMATPKGSSPGPAWTTLARDRTSPAPYGLSTTTRWRRRPGTRSGGACRCRFAPRPVLGVSGRRWHRRVPGSSSAEPGRQRRGRPIRPTEQTAEVLQAHAHSFPTPARAERLVRNPDRASRSTFFPADLPCARCAASGYVGSEESIDGLSSR